MSSITLLGDTSGSIIIDAPAIAGSNTITLPTTGGTIRTTRTPGTVLQVVNAAQTTSFSTTSGTFTNIGLSASITPTSATSKIFVIAGAIMNTQSSNLSLLLTIFRDSTDLGVRSGQYAAAAGWLATTVPCFYLDSPATTSSVTYSIRARVSAGAGTISSADPSTITLMEIAA
jgi:hypothetical protein